MTRDPQTWRYVALVLIGECLGFLLVALFLYNSSFGESVPDAVKAPFLAGSFIALFLLAMTHRPQRKA